MMRTGSLFLSLVFLILGGPIHAQGVIPLSEKGGLHAAYVVPTDAFERVDVQLIVLSGAYDDPEPSGTAHLTEHLAAISSSAALYRTPRAHDIHAATYDVSTVYINSGAPSELEMLLRVSRAILDTPSVARKFCGK